MAAQTAAALSSATATDPADLPSGAAAASSSASSSGPGVIVALAASGSDRARKVSADIDELLQAQKRAREEKKRIAAELKNARRRRNRLTKKARLLSTEDLLTVVAMREAAHRPGPPRDPTLPVPLADLALGDMGDRADASDRAAAALSDDEDAAEREE